MAPSTRIRNGKKKIEKVKEEEKHGDPEMEKKEVSEGEEDENAEEKDKKSDEDTSNDDDEEEEEESRKKSSMSEILISTTPANRPVRAKKQVDRFTIRWPSSKGISTSQGRVTTKLKDIPNVAQKPSKRQSNDNLQLFHSILFGKKAKTDVLTINLNKFSGFVWANSKERDKVKEKFEKYCLKEQLFEFCDMLDLKVSKSSSTKKKELSKKLIEFLERPRATQVSPADKEQTPKGKKQKFKALMIRATNLGKASAEGSTKKPKTCSGAKTKQKKTPEAEEMVQDENEAESIDVSDHSDKDSDSDIDRMQKEKSDQGEEESEKEDQKEEKKEMKKSSTTKIGKIKSKGKTRVKNHNPEMKSKKTANTSKAKVYARDRGKSKAIASPKKEPSAEEMHDAVSKIMNEINLDASSFSDVLRHLGSFFGMNLKHKKEEVKAIILQIANSMLSVADDGEDSDHDGEENDEEEDKEAGDTDQDNSNEEDKASEDADHNNDDDEEEEEEGEEESDEYDPHDGGDNDDNRPEEKEEEEEDTKSD